MQLLTGACEQSDLDASSRSDSFSDLPQAGSRELKTQINALLEIKHRFDAERPSSGTIDLTQDERSDSVLLRDLPGLLAEYEKRTGQVLLNEEAKLVLDTYVTNSPAMVLEPNQLLELFTALQATGEKEVLMGEAIQELARESGSSASESDDQTGTEGEESQSETQQRGSDSTRADALSRRNFAFPRSQSERVNLTNQPDGAAGGASLYRREKTTSDPPAPSGQARRPSSSHSSRDANRERRRSGETVDKDVLRGKGKAKNPPSSWPHSRPRPQALVKSDRGRRVSDISSNYSEPLDYEEPDSSSPLSASTSLQGALGLGTPSSPSFQRPARQRLSSQPEPRNHTNGGVLPRSVSSASNGFVYPRVRPATSEDGEWEQWSQEGASSPGPKSGSLASYPRGSSDRAASPGLDEKSYHAFSAISPTMGGDYFPSPSSPSRETGRTSRRSSGAGRMRLMESDVGDETLMAHDTIAIRARLEGIQRQLAEKERQYDNVQQQHEDVMSKLQDDLDEARQEISQRKRAEKESKGRENSYLDGISVLETKLATTQLALDTTREHLSKSKADYDDQVNESERLRAKVAEVQMELQRARDDEQSHAESAREWNADREAYRDSIVQLNEQISILETEASSWQEEERENRVLKEQIERLGAELEELRRGSTLLGPRSKGSEVDSGTFSKRLGSELAARLASNALDSEESESDGSGDEDGSRSGGAFDLPKKERRRKARAAGEDKQAGPQPPTQPPTYDEAAREELEKGERNRLHPPVTPDEHGEATQASNELGHQAYLSMSQNFGVRCKVYEDLLAPLQESPSTVAKEANRSVRQMLSHRVLAANYGWMINALQLLMKLPLPPAAHSYLHGAVQSEERRRFLSSLVVCLAFFVLGMGIQSFWNTPTHASLYMLEDWGISDSLLRSWDLVPGSERMQTKQGGWRSLSSPSPRVPT